MKRLLLVVAFIAFTVSAAVWPSAQDSNAQSGCFTETGFCITNPSFQEYFNLRGGSKSFGYPISRQFNFMGFPVQFFQGHIMQLQGDGRVFTMNLLQQGLMPVTKINGSTFPDNDPRLTSTAPQVGSANYSDAVVEFIRANAPNQFSGKPVGFFDRFINTVDLATAFPGGGGNSALLPLLNLEIWGVVTSAPMVDPANGGFIYQRYQRGIMHYRDECQCTERILLAQWFKSVITGDGLPADLAGQMAGTPFIRQYSPGSPNSLARPGELPGTDMTNAFTPDLGGPGPVVNPPSSGPTSTPAPTVTNDALPTVTIQIDDDRTDPGQTVNVTVIGRDDKGVNRIEWREVRADSTNDNDEDRDFDPILRERHPFDCDNHVECANVWSVAPTISGTHTLEGRARDSAGQESLPVRVELRIRAGAATATPTVTPTVTPTLQIAPPPIVP